jgi:DHA3 family macrolide efflux protein-like MFS transporter
MRHDVIWRILSSQALSSLGSSMSTVALAFMVNELTGSMLHMGGVMAVSTLPLVITSWIGGALLDRYSSKHLMVLSDAARAVLVCMMPFLAALSVFWVYLVAGLIGVFSALFNPAQIKLVGEMAPRNRLVRSNSYLSMSRDGADLIGYLAGGVVVTMAGYTPAFIVDGASYLLSAFLLVGLPHSVQQPNIQQSVVALVAESPAVFARLWRHPGLRTNLLLALLATTAVMLYSPNSYGLVLEVFQKGGIELGVMELVIASGLITGGFVMSRMSLRGDKNRYVVISLVMLGLCLLGVYFSGLLWLSVVLLGIGGLVNVGLSIPSITMFQELAANADKGRLISLRAGFGQLGLATGYLLGGLLGDAIGIQRVFAVAGGAAIVLGILIYVPYRLSARRRADAAFKAAVATGERRAAARRAAVNAALNGHHGAWAAPEMLMEEES